MLGKEQELKVGAQQKRLLSLKIMYSTQVKKHFFATICIRIGRILKYWYKLIFSSFSATICIMIGCILKYGLRFCNYFWIFCGRILKYCYRLISSNLSKKRSSRRVSDWWKVGTQLWIFSKKICWIFLPNNKSLWFYLPNFCFVGTHSKPLIGHPTMQSKMDLLGILQSYTYQVL